jgi:hypothetical protein
MIALFLRLCFLLPAGLAPLPMNGAAVARRHCDPSIPGCARAKISRCDLQR